MALAKFFLYDKTTEIVFLILDDAPDNSDYETTNKVIVNGNTRVSGIKWNNVGFYDNPTGKTVDDITDMKWKYDDVGETFSANPDYDGNPIE